MKKVILLMAVIVIAVSAVHAQEFSKGDWAANVGISLDNTDPLIFGGSVEHGLVDNVFNLDGLTFGLGAELGYCSSSNYGVKASALCIGIRAPFHYSPIPKLDLYSAPALLYASAKAKVLGVTVSDNNTDFGWTIIGARYFFSPNVGAFLEVGSKNALGLGAGISFRF